MSQPPDESDPPGDYASPPCYAAEVAPEYFGLPLADPRQAGDVAHWRRAARERLWGLRREVSASARAETARVLAGHLDALIARRVGDVAGRVISVYWPIRAELNLRPWMGTLHRRGARVALPVVERVAAPLVFRAWEPDTAMERGHWNIPVPPPSAPTLVPDIAVAPLVGWDGGGYRLGNGGGYFDRTLAVLSPRPFVVGVGIEAARLATIYPQPHDIAMDAIVTETGTRWEAHA